jgi:hypothetical protein
LVEIRGEIGEIRKFNGQLRVKLKKSETNDQNEKSVEIQGYSLGAKLNKFKSFGLTVHLLL